MYLYFPFSSSQAAEIAPALQADMEVKEAIQGAIQENGEVVQIVTSVATWERGGVVGWGV